jgi:hypothetical protein
MKNEYKEKIVNNENIINKITIEKDNIEKLYKLSLSDNCLLENKLKIKYNSFTEKQKLIICKSENENMKLKEN